MSLTWEQVAEIRTELDAHIAGSGLRPLARMLGERYDVTDDTILEVWAGRTHAAVEPTDLPRLDTEAQGKPGSARWLAWHAISEHGSAQKYTELQGLLALLLARPAPRHIVEIGGYFGGTLWALDQLREKPGHLICVDLLVMDGKMEGAAGVDYELVQADSHDPATRQRVEELLAGDPVDFLFIDGDHSLAGATADWDMYSPLVRPGGVVAFHDTGIEHENQSAHEVIPLWLRLTETHDTVHIFGTHEENHWGGIGVVFL